MKPFDKPLLVLVVAGLTVWIAATSTLHRYVKTSMRPWLLAAAAVLAVSGMISLVRTRRAIASPDASTHGDHHHHHHGRIGWLLLLPVVVAVLADPSALGASSIARGQSVLRQPRTPQIDLARFLATHSAGGQVPRLSMTQFMAAASDEQDAGLLAETDVELLGFFVTGTPEGFLLARLQIGCCAADSVPIVVDVRDPDATRYEPDTWLAVTGRFDRTATEARLANIRASGETPYPVFVASNVRPASAPDPVYEYPF